MPDNVPDTPPQGMESVSWVMVLCVLSIYIFSVLAKGFFGDNVSGLIA